MQTRTPDPERRPSRLPASSFSLRRRAAAVGGGLWVMASALAFPPAPHHTLYGSVRDEMGEPLRVAGAVVELETLAGVRLKTAVVPELGPGLNYRLRVPMDAGLTADDYRPTALRPAVSFRMKVRIGAVAYLPLETRVHCAQVGQPAARTRLDLTLGEDSDGDGLPDAWERALLAARGGGLTLADIRPEDDADGDGLTNLAEYRAGTYAFDPQDGFRVDLVALNQDGPVLAFLALRGRTYTLYGSTDLETWVPVAFRIGNGGEAAAPWRDAFTASAVHLLQIEAAVPPGSRLQAFKMRVQ